jgi:hypothetical protein
VKHVNDHILNNVHLKRIDLYAKNLLKNIYMHKNCTPFEVIQCFYHFALPICVKRKN